MTQCSYSLVVSHWKLGVISSLKLGGIVILQSTHVEVGYYQGNNIFIVILQREVRINLPDSVQSILCGLVVAVISCNLPLDSGDTLSE